MTARMQISNVAAKAMCDALVDSLDVGGAGYIEIRSGSAPADVDTAATGTLLATLTLSATAFGNAADANPGAIATAAAITSDSSADATNTAGYFRAYSGAGVAKIDGTVGTSAADMILNTTSIVAGTVVSCSSWTITISEG